MIIFPDYNGFGEALVPTLRGGMPTGRSASVFYNKAQFWPVSSLAFPISIAFFETY